MGATFFLVILFIGGLLLCAVTLVIVSAILLFVRAKRGKRGKPLKRRYTALRAVLLVLALFCAVPSIVVLSYIRTNTAELENHINYGTAVVAAKDGTFAYKNTVYYPVEICSVSDTAELSEPVANYFDAASGHLPMRIYFRAMGVYGEPVYRVKNQQDFDLLWAAGLLFCAERDTDSLISFCNTYDSWEKFKLSGRHLDVPDTEVSLSVETFTEMSLWRDGAHAPDNEAIYGDLLTLSAVTSDGSLLCPLMDFCLTDSGEWMIQYIVQSETEDVQFSTERMPIQWAEDILPALNQIMGKLLAPDEERA